MLFYWVKNKFVVLQSCWRSFYDFIDMFIFYKLLQELQIIILQTYICDGS